MSDPHRPAPDVPRLPNDHTLVEIDLEVLRGCRRHVTRDGFGPRAGDAGGMARAALETT